MWPPSVQITAWIVTIDPITAPNTNSVGPFREDDAENAAGDQRN
jgi:hypothetical protein